MKRHSPGVQVGGSTRNRISHAGTRGRLTENPVRLTEKNGRPDRNPCRRPKIRFTV